MKSMQVLCDFLILFSSESREEESEFDLYTRIGLLFNPDDPTFAVDAKYALGLDKGLEFYGYAQQGAYGD